MSNNIPNWRDPLAVILVMLSGTFLIAACSQSTPTTRAVDGLYFAHVEEFHTITTGLGKKGDKTRNKPGEAIGVLDFNRDGLEDFVILNSTQQFFLFENTRNSMGEHEFTMTTHEVADVQDGKHRVAKTLGVHDFNDDGFLDLHLGTMGKGTERTAWRPRKTGLKRAGDYCTQINQRDGTFMYQDIGADGDGSKRAIVFGDFDGDGRFDAYINTSPYFGPWYSGSPAPTQLYPGIGDQGQFGPDIIDTLLVNAPDNFWHDDAGNGNVNFKGAVIRDFDLDGKPDIVSGAIADIRGDPFGNKVQPSDGPAYQGDWKRGIFVLRNVSEPGSIRFEEVSHAAIDNAYGKTDQMHVTTLFPADFNNDSRLDLVAVGPRDELLAGAMEHNTDMIRLYLNHSSPGKIQFTDVTENSGLDFFNDPDQGAARPYLADDKGRLQFESISVYNAVAMDIDNDTDKDIVLLEVGVGGATASGLPTVPGWVFINDGKAGFTTVGPIKTGLIAGAKHMTLGDFNADGKMDIIASKPDHLASTKGGNNLYFNIHDNDNNYLSVEVSSPKNKLGIGTKVAVFASGTDNLIGYDEVRTDFGYRSKKSNLLHFGLAQHQLVDVELTGRNGRTIRHNALAANQRHQLNLP